MVLISGFWVTIFQIENMKPVLYNALKIPSLKLHISLQSEGSRAVLPKQILQFHRFSAQEMTRR